MIPAKDLLSDRQVQYWLLHAAWLLKHNLCYNFDRSSTGTCQVMGIKVRSTVRSFTIVLVYLLSHKLLVLICFVQITICLQRYCAQTARFVIVLFYVFLSFSGKKSWKLYWKEIFIIYLLVLKIKVLQKLPYQICTKNE